MHNRRKFLKGFLAGGVALGMWEDTSTGALAKSCDDEVREVPKCFAWQTTIFCQFGDPGLLSDVGAYARRIGCDIYHGEPFSPDIFAIPYFVAIVDRSTLTSESWAEYLEFREEVEDTTPCILVDSLGASDGWPIYDRMEILDPNIKHHVHGILDRIREAHLVAQEWRIENDLLGP